MSHQVVLGTLYEVRGKWRGHCGNCDWIAPRYRSQERAARVFLRHYRKMRRQESRET